MTRSSKVLSRIDAAANIQVFLLEQRYFQTSSSSSKCQNDAIVKDVLRLAEYIRSQCRLLQKTDLKLLDENKDNEGAEASLGFNSTRNIFLPDKFVKSFESGTVSVDSPSPNVGEKSPGFDRLLNKILSPSKPVAPDVLAISAPTPASPTVLPEVNTETNSTERDIPSKFLTLESPLPTSPSTVTIERIFSYADPSRCQRDKFAAAPEILDPNISYVRDFNGENYSDDDDDDVFDLLKSVDDWPALRTFFRGEMPTNGDVLENELGHSRGEHDSPIDDDLRGRC